MKQTKTPAKAPPPRKTATAPRTVEPSTTVWAARLRWPALVLAALCLLGLFSTEIADTDFWWHLKTGEYIVRNRALPSPDPFSYTTYLGKPAYPGEEEIRYFNLTHEWLAQAGWYGIYRLGGFPALVLWKALLLAGFCAIAGWVAQKRAGGKPGEFPYWGLAATATTASLASLFDADRPALITFLFVAVFVWVLERGGPLWILPILSVVWANSHGGYFLGWAVVGAYAAAAIVRRDPDARKLAATTLACVLISGLNPSHFRIIEILLHYRQSQLQQSLVEWTRPPLWGPPYAFDILLYSAAAVLLLAWRRVRWSDWLLFGAFAAAALTAYRNVILIGFLAPVLIASYFPWRRALPAVAAPVVTIALAAALISGISRGQFYQLRAAIWRAPSGAAEWVLAHAGSERIFNTYELGGYLIWRLWPQQRVFIDGRALNESVYQDYIKILGNTGGGPDRDTLLERYGARVIIANAFEYTSGVLYPLIPALAEPGEAHWQLVYNDSQALVFWRDPPPQIAALPKSGIRSHLESECKLAIDHDAELCLCARTLGALFAQQGDAAQARQWLGLYLASPHQPDPEAEQAYRSLSRR